MKRIIAVILILSAFALLFAGCGEDKDADTTTETTTSGTDVSDTTGTTITGETTSSVSGGATATTKTTVKTTTKKPTATTAKETKIWYIYAISGGGNPTQNGYYVSRLEISFTNRIDTTYIQDNSKSYTQRGLKALLNGTEVAKSQYGATPIHCNMEGKNDNRVQIMFVDGPAPGYIKYEDALKLSVEVVANKIKDADGKFVEAHTRKVDTDKKYPNGVGEHLYDKTPYYLAAK